MKKNFLIMALFAAITCCANASQAASQSDLIEACKQKDFQKCAELTTALLDDFDYDNALKYAKMACDFGDGASCATAGDILANQSVDENEGKVFKEANTYYLKACELKSGTGCTAVGLNYEQGKGIGPDYAKAAQYFKQACDLKDPQGCFNMGRMYSIGVGGKQDHPKAIEFLKRACDLNDAKSCASVGVYIYNGTGIKQNFKEASKYFNKSCDLNNNTGCTYAGLMYERERRGGEKGLRQGLSIF